MNYISLNVKNVINIKFCHPTRREKNLKIQKWQMSLPISYKVQNRTKKCFGITLWYLTSNRSAVIEYVYVIRF